MCHDESFLLCAISPDEFIEEFIYNTFEGCIKSSIALFLSFVFLSLMHQLQRLVDSYTNV